MTSDSKNEAEALRLARLYEGLREKLLDLSLRNRMLNYRMSEKSKSQLRIVDEIPEQIYKRLVLDERGLRVQPLPEPPSVGKDEQSEDFLAELAHRKVSDPDYIDQISGLDPDDPAHEARFEQAESVLRDRIRKVLGLPSRRLPREVKRSEHARSNGVDASPDLPASGTKGSHEDGALQTLRYPDELDAVLDSIKANARLAEQEMGLSTLFLAFGFLEWTESEASSRKLFAPLLLLPVKLDIKPRNGRDEYSVFTREQDAESNLSLQKYLEKEWRLQIPTFTPSEDCRDPIESYFRLVSEILQSDSAPQWIKERWRVRRWLVLGPFAFGRLAMYADLDPLKWKGAPSSNPIVASILRGTDGSVTSAQEVFSSPDNYDIDDPAIEKIAPLLIHDADASQHSAIIDVMKGHNLVIQGPPGTGKSQTITNIIANAMAVGKKVLFLAEKQAALDVVKRRLQAAGLGEYCLELHSDRLAPKTVISSLRKRIDLGFSDRDVQGTDDPGLTTNKRALRQYLDELHHRHTTDTSPFEDIWDSISGHRQAGEYIGYFADIKMPVRDLDSPTKFSEVRAMLALYSSQALEYEKLHGHPSITSWCKVPLTKLNPADLPDFLNDLEKLAGCLDNLSSLLISCEVMGISTENELSIVIDADRLLPPSVPPIGTLWHYSSKELESVATLSRQATELQSQLNSLPPLDGLSDVGETALRRLGELQLPDELLKLPPARLMEFLPQRIRLLKDQQAVLAGLGPLLSTLGLDDTISVPAIKSLATGSSLLSKLHGDWIGWYRASKIGDEEFKQIHGHWRSLLEGEERWRVRYPKSLGRAWPDSLSLRAAADEVDQTRLSKLLRNFRSKPSILTAVAAELQETVQDVLPAELKELASHVDALLSFEQDSGYAERLGSLWDGLNSPFSFIADGLTQLQVFVENVAALEHGLTIRDRLLKSVMVDGREPRDLEAAVGVLGVIGDSYASTHRHLSDWKIAVSEEISLLQDIVAVGLPRELETLHQSLDAILQALALKKRHELLEVQLLSSPVGKDVLERSHSLSDVDDVREIAKWLHIVKQTKLNRAVSQRLTSETAVDLRVQLAIVAEKARAIVPAKRILLDSLRSHLQAPFLTDVMIEESSTILRDLLSARQTARDLLQLRRTEQPLLDAGLGAFISKAEEHQVPYDKLDRLLTSILASRRATRAIRDGIQLSNVGAKIEAQRTQFAKRDLEKIQRDRQYLKFKLKRCSPPAGSDFGSRMTWTELAMIKKEIDKSTRFEPVRALLTRAGKATQELKPCFMMSPLSLAKFSGDKMLQFDLLVIDEASQMKPEDALGGLLRAKQVVVVGDRKQLPPTDFFSRSGSSPEVDDDQDDVVTDSILENCEGAFRRVRPLSWHYRSRCESLIRFANTHFYDNKLITFPAPVPNSFSIDHIRVAGSYRGSRNQAEASELVEATIRFMHQHHEWEPSQVPSIGLVAINSQQRDLIREEFIRLTTSDEKVARYLEAVQQKGEEFFTKNLENVQGDERDYIFISMTYGPEPGSTAMHQRFGPINSSQGHRRLNVLFSRARIRIGLFTSFGSASVVPSETSREGVHILRRYLEYVEAKGASLADSKGVMTESGFELEVLERLQARGYTVDPQVGVSGYRIDLGVRHPDDLSRYIAGIECDGATYHSSKSARDRDRIREAVLRDLGWSILRQWSTDWFYDAASETDKLVSRIESLRSVRRPTDRNFVVVQSQHFAGGVTELPKAEEIKLRGTPVIHLHHKDDAFQPPLPLEVPVNFDWDGQVPITVDDARRLLAQFRESVVRPAVIDWDSARSILRDSMIEMFIAQRFDDSADWTRKVPMYLRQGTAPQEKQYLDQIAAIVTRTGQ